MVVSLLVAFSALLFIVYPAGAQISAPNCSDSSSDWKWLLNSLGQNPCLVAAYLASACFDGSYHTIAPLPPHYSYAGPSGFDNGDLCICNTVAYNLFSACDACQGSRWISYSEWSFNCTSIAEAGTFPKPVPVGTRVPYWAYINPTATDYWDLAAAQLAGDSPEVTSGAPIVPTSTRKDQSTISPMPLSSISPSSSDPSSKSSSNAGKIAGGVVGGLAVAALIAGIVFWFIIRRRRARTAPSSEFYIDGQSGTRREAAPYSSTIEALRAYDPSDPSTYPTHMTQTTDYSGQSGSRSEPSYRGLPEIHQERPPALARGDPGLMM